ncbi:Fanconi-associated nuclease 1 [Schistosoma japonicum]|uniref:Fanconi-associated nuclease n=1 Tax=Schistosoma japonicum TaxID=6182 RepID=A0A4Z2CVU5_SCHJA|nr:Fanconi-associated nuclease 1 [Schistosoma japonicum]
MLKLDEVNPEDMSGDVSESIPSNLISNIYAIDSINDALLLLKSEPVFSNLFDEDEQMWLEKFKNLSNQSKSLVIRLYGRSQKIFRKSEFIKIIPNYTEQCLSELRCLGFISTDMQSLSAETLIHSLNRLELDQLAGMYNIKNFKSLTMAQLKDTLLKTSSISPMASFFKFPTQSKDKFKGLITRILDGCWHVNETYTQLITRLLCLISLGSESAHNRPNKLQSIEALLKTELYSMLLVRRGEVIFPSYVVNRKSTLYRTSEEFQKFLEFMSLEIRLEYLISQKLYDFGMQLCLDKKTKLIDDVTNLSFRRTDLPQFLRRFTSPYRAFRSLLLMIDIYERQRKYNEAIKLIETLLSLTWSLNDDDQFVNLKLHGCVLDQLGPCRLGYLLNRYIINQGTHEKQPIKTLKFVVNYFKLHNQCKCLRAGRRLMIHEQLIKLYDSVRKEKNSLCKLQNGDTIDNTCINVTNTYNNDNSNAVDNEINNTINQVKRRRIKKSTNQDNDITKEVYQVNDFCVDVVEKELFANMPSLVENIKEPPKVEITAPVNASAKEIGTHRPHYVWHENISPNKHQQQQSPQQSNTLLLTVEQWTIRYYLANKHFECGIHCESQIYHLLFCILFYDILFEISPCPPDVFYSYRQSAPLDLFTDEFYQSRKNLIDTRLHWLLNVDRSSDHSSSNSLAFRINTYWNLHFGERCLWANWDLVKSSQELIDIFWCLGPRVVYDVCYKLATDYRSWKSGLPDLLLWSPTETRAKIVEVKGPGDHLSTQQIMWLDVLFQAGADVEICLVSAEPLKSLRSKFNENVTETKA